MAKYLSEEDMKTGEYISRDEALKIFHQYCDNCTSSYNGVMCRACSNADAMDILIDIPAADVQPVKCGRWIGIYEYCEKNGYVPSGMGIYYWCSECNKSEQKKSDFCPNCGVRMDGDTE